MAIWIRKIRWKNFFDNSDRLSYKFSFYFLAVSLLLVCRLARGSQPLCNTIAPYRKSIMHFLVCHLPFGHVRGFTVAFRVAGSYFFNSNYWQYQKIKGRKIAKHFLETTKLNWKMQKTVPICYFHSNPSVIAEEWHFVKKRLKTWKMAWIYSIFSFCFFGKNLIITDEPEKKIDNRSFSKIYAKSSLQLQGPGFTLWGAYNTVFKSLLLEKEGSSKV